MSRHGTHSTFESPPRHRGSLSVCLFVLFGRVDRLDDCFFTRLARANGRALSFAPGKKKSEFGSKGRRCDSLTNFFFFTCRRYLLFSGHGWRVRLPVPDATTSQSRASHGERGENMRTRQRNETRLAGNGLDCIPRVFN